MSKLIFPKNTNDSKRLSNKLREGKVRRIAHGIYTEDLESPVDSIILDRWMEIVPFIVPNSILSFRSALELRPAKDIRPSQFIVFVTSTYSKDITIGPLIIKVTKGDTANFTEPILTNLQRSNASRALLENLSQSKVKIHLAKTMGKRIVEEYLVKILDHQGESGLNKIRDEAKVIATKLNLNDQYNILIKMISSLLVSNSERGILQTKQALAISNKQPFDSYRVALFETFAVFLAKCVFNSRPYKYESSSWRSISFFESYFSNYIEGTEFLIDEAENIVFKNQKIKNRIADSHDISALFHLVSDYSDMTEVPNTFDHFLDILKSRHSMLMKARSDKRPGEFKEIDNRAGSTIFVSPTKMIGTLNQGFLIYQKLKQGIERALFMMFLISETHPFDDGNGRIARLMMNVELSTVDQMKCIVPTADRENYLNGLRRCSRDGEFKLFCKVMDQCQAYTSSIDWTDYGNARLVLEEDMANCEPDDGLPIFNRALRKLKLSFLG